MWLCLYHFILKCGIWQWLICFLTHSRTISHKKYAQQISEMQQNRQHLQPELISRKDPILHNIWLYVAQPTLQKLISIHPWSFASSSMSPDISSTDYHFFKNLDHFMKEKNTFTTNKMQKMLSKSALYPEAQIFIQ